MRAWTFQLVRTTLIVTLLSFAGSPSSVPANDARGIAGQTPQARLGPEVRLRKLHLVRPDLIPYPICYEIYC